MKIVIVYDSITGNTKMLADKIASVLKDEDIVYNGKVKDDIDKADIYFVGSWTDKGNASENIKRYLSSLRCEKIAYFGTAGFGESSEYFDAIANNVDACIDSSNTIVDHYICQGKMPKRVKDRYQDMLKQDAGNKRLRMAIANFDKALSHPDAEDISNVGAWAKGVINKIMQ